MRLRWTEIRFRRRYILIPILVMMIVPILIVWSSMLSRPNTSDTNRDNSLPSPFCRKGDPLAGVYNPKRFRILSACEIGSGIVNSVILQADGSAWVEVALDHQYSKLLGPGNISQLGGQLVLEEVSADLASMLSKGEQISFVGPLVDDTNGEFNAIVPVWSITLS